MAPADFGGLESVVRLLARGQRSLGHHVTVVAVVEPGVEDHAFTRALTQDGTPSTVIRVAGRDYIGERRAIRRLCVVEKPDILHTHGYRPDIVDSGVARSIGVQTVTTVHGFTGGGIRNRINEWLQERSLRNFAAVVAVSEHMAVRLIRRGARSSRMHVIPNAYDPGRPMLERATARLQLRGEGGEGGGGGERIISNDEFVVGWVGRLSREKGPDVLVEALARMQTTGLRVAVIGDGPEGRALGARARALGVADVIQWCGVVANAGALFSAFDVFVLSSRTEGIPVVLLEAMAARVPIVTTRAGGVPEMLTDQDALLVPVENADALAAAITETRDNPGAARARAVAARARLERDFTLDAWVQRYELLYRSVLRDRAANAR